jgi:lipoprotein-anchoring transpeptidase ErfK/SrfK
MLHLLNNLRLGMRLAVLPPEETRRQLMRSAKGESKESRTVAIAAIIMVAAISALAEEKIQTRRIIVSIQDRKLALLQGDIAIKIWETAVGAESTPSPVGEYTINTRLSRPTYFHPGKVIAPGPSNPLGTRWLGLNIKGFGIHGTNVPSSIGKNSSHGCIRMRNRDIEELFALVQVGDAVEIYNETNTYLTQIFQPEIKPEPLVVLSASATAFFNMN